MDIFKYLNSNDVRKYLKSIDYKFSAPDAAWIVERSVGLPLDEKISAWNEIMDTMSAATRNTTNITTNMRIVIILLLIFIWDPSVVWMIAFLT